MRIIFNRIVFILLVILHSCVPMDTKHTISYTQHPLSQIQVLRITPHINYTNHVVNNTQVLKKISIWVDNKFNTKEQLNIISAVNEWRIALNNTIQLNIVNISFDIEKIKEKKIYGNDNWIIYKINEENKFYLKEPGRITLGLANNIGGNLIYLVDNEWNKDRDSLKLVLMHEISHLLGLTHDGKYLMNSEFNYNSYLCIDEETMQRISKLYNIDKLSLNYCNRK